jgi:16S rRNA processing protein RimM
MGRVVAPWGVRGWLKIEPFTRETESLLDYRTWWLAPAGGQAQRPLRVEEGRRHGAMLIAKLEGIESPEQGAAFRGAEVAVPRDALPEEGPDEVYREDLLGCRVVNRSGEWLGTVVGVTEHGAHAILRVATAVDGAPERLIPCVPAYVDAVDLEQRRVDVDWQADY